MVEPDTLNPLFLPVVETFHSVQGEGGWTGINAFFIRLRGCDVGCPQRNIADLVTEAKAANPEIVVVTGGEPLIHDLTFLSTDLRTAGLQVHLETSGAHSFSGNFDWVNILS